MSIVVIGKSGQVSKAFQKLSDLTNTKLSILDRSDLDLENIGEISKKLEKYKHAKWIINLAAFTSVDLAESQKVKAFTINHLATQAIDKITQIQNQYFIHLSTDYVFDGSNKKLIKQRNGYTEKDNTKPLNTYGKSKLLGEQAIQNPNHIILRTSWVFGEGGENFVKTIVNLLINREKICVVNDQIGCPTATLDIARVILELVRQQPSVFGTFHYASNNYVSWYEFACKIKNSLQKISDTRLADIEPISSDNYPSAAPRPKYSVLNTNKIESLGIARRNWEDYLDDVVVDSYHRIAGEFKK